MLRPHRGRGVALAFAQVTTAMFADYTAEFLLTRGPYAMLGYSW